MRGYPDRLELLATKTALLGSAPLGAGDTEVLGGGVQEAFDVQAFGAAESWMLGHRGHPRVCDTVDGKTR